jgi:hypothetical protein
MNRDMEELIKGVPAFIYGVWCPHGHHIYVIDTDDFSPYPGVVPADPWPCEQGCTPETVEAAYEAEARAYEEEQR